MAYGTYPFEYLLVMIIDEFFPPSDTFLGNEEVNCEWPMEKAALLIFGVGDNPHFDIFGTIDK
jgi:hypothetical protein